MTLNPRPVEGGLRIRDLDLAAQLSFERPRKIRETGDPTLT